MDDKFYLFNVALFGFICARSRHFSYFLSSFQFAKAALDLKVPVVGIRFFDMLGTGFGTENMKTVTCIGQVQGCDWLFPLRNGHDLHRDDLGTENAETMIIKLIIDIKGYKLG